MSEFKDRTRSDIQKLAKEIGRWDTWDDSVSPAHDISLAQKINLIAEHLKIDFTQDCAPKVVKVTKKSKKNLGGTRFSFPVLPY